eukprot:gene2844-1829_t
MHYKTSTQLQAQSVNQIINELIPTTSRNSLQTYHMHTVHRSHQPTNPVQQQHKLNTHNDNSTHDTKQTSTATNLLLKVTRRQQLTHNHLRTAQPRHCYIPVHQQLPTFQFTINAQTQNLCKLTKKTTLQWPPTKHTHSLHKVQASNPATIPKSNPETISNHNVHKPLGATHYLSQTPNHHPAHPRNSANSEESSANCNLITTSRSRNCCIPAQNSSKIQPTRTTHLNQTQKSKRTHHTLPTQQYQNHKTWHLNPIPGIKTEAAKSSEYKFLGGTTCLPKSTYTLKTQTFETQTIDQKARLRGSCTLEISHQNRNLKLQVHSTKCLRQNISRANKKHLNPSTKSQHCLTSTSLQQTQSPSTDIHHNPKITYTTPKWISSTLYYSNPPASQITPASNKFETNLRGPMCMPSTHIKNTLKIASTLHGIPVPTDQQKQQLTPKPKHETAALPIPRGPKITCTPTPAERPTKPRYTARVVLLPDTHGTTPHLCRPQFQHIRKQPHATNWVLNSTNSLTLNEEQPEIHEKSNAPPNYSRAFNPKVQ